MTPVISRFSYGTRGGLTITATELFKTKIPPENRRDLKYSHEKQTLVKLLMRFLFVTFFKLINTTCSINQYIFTSIKRVRCI